MTADSFLPDAELVYRAGDTIHEQPLHAYPDGMPRVTAPVAIPETVLLRPKSLASFTTALYWVDALAHRGHAVPSLVLPFIPGARQDRVNPCGDVLFTLKSVARDLNARRFRTIVVLDPHSDVAAALIDRCEVATALVPFERAYDGVIAPDGGAERRAARVAQSMSIPLYHAWKTRSVRTGQLDGFGSEPIPPGHYLVVDDICDGGGTFLGLADTLDASHARADLYVTHGLFTRGTQPLLDRYDRVFCTDSVIGDRPGVTVLPRCASLLAAMGELQ